MFECEIQIEFSVTQDILGRGNTDFQLEMNIVHTIFEQERALY